MSSTSTLPTGVQQLYNDGLLPSSLNASVLNGASTTQLNQIVGSTIASQQVGALLGVGGSSGDTANLSTTANNALLQEINPTSSYNTNSTSSTDPLTAAVDNALTSSLNAAVSKFVTPSSSTTGSNINVVG